MTSERDLPEKIGAEYEEEFRRLTQDLNLHPEDAAREMGIPYSMAMAKWKHHPVLKKAWLALGSKPRRRSIRGRLKKTTTPLEIKTMFAQGLAEAGVYDKYLNRLAAADEFSDEGWQDIMFTMDRVLRNVMPRESHVTQEAPIQKMDSDELEAKLAEVMRRKQEVEKEQELALETLRGLGVIDVESEPSGQPEPAEEGGAGDQGGAAEEGGEEPPQDLPASP